MGITKRYLFDPEFAQKRQQAAEATVAAFPHRTPAEEQILRTLASGPLLEERLPRPSRPAAPWTPLSIRG